MEDWHEFYLGQVGAAAALGGLVFVGISINLAKIMESVQLPNRAQEALMLLLAVLILSSLALTPGLDRAGFGAAAAGLGLAAWAGASTLHWRTLRGAKPPFRRPAIAVAALGQVITIGLSASGAALFLGWDAGLQGVVAAMMLSYLAVFIHAWVLLVEINR